MTDKYKNKYPNQSIRLQKWDYRSNGDYFVTICTKNRENYFGDVVDGKMNLSGIGIIAEKFWIEIPNHFPFVKLDTFVIMPDHIHGIIVINKDKHDGVWSPDSGDPTTAQPTSKGRKLSRTAAATEKWMPESLGVIINQYKRICTINARKTNQNSAWQTRFYDHIIRNSTSLKQIRNYIINNPMKWGNK